MDTCLYIRALVFLFYATLIAAGGTQVTWAGEPDKPLVLRSVMQQLGRDMQSVTDAISREDWPRVAGLAPDIGRHATPPLREKMRILAWLGSDAGKFRGFDAQTQDAAQAMGEAAAAGDGQAVIATFASVQQSCLGCHESYRDSFRARFYGSAVTTPDGS